jgi:hypothetical protein
MLSKGWYISSIKFQTPNSLALSSSLNGRRDGRPQEVNIRQLQNSEPILRGQRCQALSKVPDIFDLLEFKQSTTFNLSFQVS